ncbi:MAG: SPOR domain-containing protein [Deltaproteobacteria bacterium]|nr:SPOR domain-containing protein [Deltaproteobacteria bacterium]MBW2339279.1 SPOR domain-containing protein [Deltaproteobacteria bacterium]
MANRKSSSKKIKKRYTFRPTIGSLLLFCFGVIFVLAWVFCLGVIVGRNFLPIAFGTFSRTKETIVEPKEEKKRDHVEPIKEEELTFYNQLVNKKERAKEEISSRLSVKEPDRKKKQTHVWQTSEDSRHYSVQVIALKDKEKTEQMVKRLSSLGYHAYYYQTLINGEIFYRVRCGPFYTIPEAKKYAKRLADREGLKPFVVYPSKTD